MHHIAGNDVSLVLSKLNLGIRYLYYIYIAYIRPVI